MILEINGKLDADFFIYDGTFWLIFNQNQAKKKPFLRALNLPIFYTKRIFCFFTPIPLD